LAHLETRLPILSRRFGFADPKLKAQLADQGGIEMAGTPADFGKLIADETEKWAKVIRSANIRL
jgi:hypothetical protein